MVSVRSLSSLVWAEWTFLADSCKWTTKWFAATTAGVAVWIAGGTTAAWEWETPKVRCTMTGRLRFRLRPNPSLTLRVRIATGPWWGALSKGETVITLDSRAREIQATPDAWVFPQTTSPIEPMWDSTVREALHEAADAEGCDFRVGWTTSTKTRPTSLLNSKSFVM